MHHVCWLLSMTVVVTITAVLSTKEDHQSDTKEEDYIPFQWNVEIIKREYDDYILPDGKVYRVPQGQVPPHRYKGKVPYNLPYYVYRLDNFNPADDHFGTNYGAPKLVESFDSQALEYQYNDWYDREVWDRYRWGPRYNNDAMDYRYRYSDSSDSYGNKEGNGPSYDHVPDSSISKSLATQASKSSGPSTNWPLTSSIQHHQSSSITSKRPKASPIHKRFIHLTSKRK